MAAPVVRNCVVPGCLTVNADPEKWWLVPCNYCPSCYCTQHSLTYLAECDECDSLYCSKHNNQCPSSEHFTGAQQLPVQNDAVDQVVHRDASQGVAGGLHRVQENALKGS